jgi:hypothetical protein
MPIDANIAVGKLNFVVGDPTKLPATPENNAWLTKIVEPTVQPQLPPNPIPELSLTLEHVYGYESQTLRNSVRYTSNVSEMVHATFTLGIVTNLKNNSQKIYKVFIVNLFIFCGCGIFLKTLITSIFDLF